MTKQVFSLCGWVGNYFASMLLIYWFAAIPEDIPFHMRHQLWDIIFLEICL